MKPAPFEYVAPTTLDQAVAALGAAGAEARVLAGGQTLGPMLNMRLATPRRLVDIGRIAHLKTIEERDDVLVIGAGVTHAMLEDRSDPSPTGRLLANIASTIAYRAIRNRGTIGGSLAHADPAADWIAAMLLLDATLLISGPSATRPVQMRDFMTGAFSTAIRHSEILAAIEIPKLSPQARWGYYKVCRKIGEFPDAIGAAILDPPRALSRIVVGALDGVPAVLSSLAQEVARAGAAAATAQAVTEAVKLAASTIDPVDLQLHAVAVRRAVLQAVGA